MTPCFMGTQGGVDNSPIWAAEIPLDLFEHIDNPYAHDELSAATNGQPIQFVDISRDNPLQINDNKSPSFKLYSSFLDNDFPNFDLDLSSLDITKISTTEMARSQESVVSDSSDDDNNQLQTAPVQNRPSLHRHYDSSQPITVNTANGASVDTSRDLQFSNAPSGFGTQLSTTTSTTQVPRTQPLQSLPRTPRFVQSGFGPSLFPSLVAPLNQPMTAAAQLPPPPPQDIGLPALLPQPAQPAQVPHPQPSSTTTTTTTTTTPQSFMPVRAAQRSTRTRNTWLHRSDNWPNLPDSYRVYDQNQPQHVPRTVGRGKRSGRNLMATFGNDKTLRTRVALIVERARPETKFGAGKHTRGNAVIPVGTSLQEIATNYPLHVWGDGLRLFMAEGWSEEQIWNALPGNARLQDAASRPWNYIQAATGREADRIVVEEGHAPRKAQRRRKQSDSGAARNDNSKGDTTKNADVASDHNRTAKRKRLSDGGQSLVTPRGASIPPFSTVPHQSITQASTPFPPNPFRVLSGLPQQPVLPSISHPNQQNPATNLQQPATSQLSQLTTQIEAERTALNKAHLEYLREIQPGFAQMNAQSQTNYATGYGARYLRDWQEGLIRRYVQREYLVLIPTNGPVQHRELEIFRQIRRLSHFAPGSDPALQHAEDVSALQDLLRRMRELRLSRQGLTNSIRRDRNEFASLVRRSNAINQQHQLPSLNPRQATVQPAVVSRASAVSPALVTQQQSIPYTSTSSNVAFSANPNQGSQRSTSVLAQTAFHFPSHNRPGSVRSDQPVNWLFLIFGHANDLDRPEIAAHYLHITLQQAQAALAHDFVPLRSGETFESWWAQVMQAGSRYAQG